MPAYAHCRICERAFRIIPECKWHRVRACCKEHYEAIVSRRQGYHSRIEAAKAQAERAANDELRDLAGIAARKAEIDAKRPPIVVVPDEPEAEKAVRATCGDAVATGVGVGAVREYHSSARRGKMLAGCLLLALSLCGQALATTPAQEPLRERVDVIHKNAVCAKITGRGNANSRIPKHEQAVKEPAMSEVQSICAPEEKLEAEFRDVAGFEGLYQVSNTGLVRSLDRRLPKSDGTTQFFRGRVLRPSVHQDGYLCVNLQHCGKIVGRLVHRLVAAAFIGPRPDGLEVNHKDGVKTNNAVANLEYITHAENCCHARDNGLRVALRGSKSPRARLNEDQVRAIAIALGSVPGVVLARQFGVSPSIISLIAKGKAWSHLTGIAKGGEKCRS